MSRSDEAERAYRRLRKRAEGTRLAEAEKARKERLETEKEREASDKTPDAEGVF